MNKILYLSLILFFIIVFSSFMRYEHFDTIFKLKFGKDKPDKPDIPDNNNNNVQIKNVSNKDIYIVFTKGPGDYWNELDNNWYFYKDTTVITGITIGLNDSMTYFGPIQNTSIFSCKYKKQDSPKWISGKCCIISSEPPSDFDAAGLTALEWTFNPGDSFNPDLSALEGINIKADMEVLHGNGCDTTDKKICKIDFNDPKVPKYIKTTKGIKRIIRPEWDRNTDWQYAGYNDENKQEQSPCGLTSKDKQDCIKCPFDNNPCKEGDDLLNPCYPRSISAKWGCYKWWANPKNHKAQDWLDIYKTGEGCKDSYRWVFDETGIYLPDGSSKLPTLNKKFWNEGDEWNKNSIEWQCATSRPTTPDLKSKCKGLPVSKINAPNINCASAGIDTKLIYTIYEVL
jgi:hypothetical protein